VPALQTAIDESIDRMFDLVRAKKVSTWDGLKAAAKEDRPMAAVMALGEGLDQAGMTLPVPDDVRIIYGRYIPIPFFDDIGIPTDAKIVEADTPITKAIGSYVGFVRAVDRAIDTVQDVLDVAKYVAFPLVSIVQGVLDLLKTMINDALDALREEIKHQLNMFLVRMLDTISGVDTRDQRDRTVGDALHVAVEKVEEFEHQTSLDAHLRPGGDLAGLSKDELEPVVGPVTERDGGGWKASNPLPPSHSEIAKDHAPEADRLKTHDSGHPVRDAISDATSSDATPLDPEAQKRGAADQHDTEAGSIFYGLASALALEAVRHVLSQVELMWAESPQGAVNPSLYGDEVALNTSTLTVGHDAFTAEAQGRADQEKLRAEKQKYKFAQSDSVNQNFLAQRPAAQNLMNLVDLIISHPDDSKWWRPVFDQYIAKHPDEVAQHIRERNAVRGARTTVRG
jgi:hypothetical protein